MKHDLDPSVSNWMAENHAEQLEFHRRMQPGAKRPVRRLARLRRHIETLFVVAVFTVVCFAIAFANTPWVKP